MKQNRILCLVLIAICASASAETYKCKTAKGNTEFSDQPCRDSAKTISVTEKEYISESQRKSSTEWLQHGADRLHRKEQAEAVAAREARRQEAVRQAAYQEEMRRRQEAADRQRLINETIAARQEAAEARAAAERANAAANAAAANNDGAPRPCRIVGRYCY